jgi:hypothetical protein
MGLQHLREAHEELGRTIAEIGETPDHGSGELQVLMSHLYHHLNTAWNALRLPVNELSPSTFESIVDRTCRPT